MSGSSHSTGGQEAQGSRSGAAESVLVGNSGGRAAVLGALPEPAITSDEVETFVRSLLNYDAIDFGVKPKGLVATKKASINPVTHKIKMIGGQGAELRFRFACRYCGQTGQLASRVPATN